MFRIFLFGESARSRPGRVGKELENCSLCSMLARSIVAFVFRFLNDARGDEESGDSGGERGEGSVSEDSTVEIVVVGEDSVDANVDVESRRVIGEEKWAMLLCLLYVFVVRFGVCAATASPTFRSSLSGPFPNTDINEGKDVSSDCELVETGIFGSGSSSDKLCFAGLFITEGPYTTSSLTDSFVG